MLTGIAGALGWWLTTWSVRTWSTATATRYLALDYTVNAGTLAYLFRPYQIVRTPKTRAQQPVRS